MMKSKNYNVMIVFFNVVAAIAIIVVFFSGKDFSYNHIESSRKIGACYMTLGSDYFVMLNNEIESMVDKNNDVLIKRDSYMTQEIQNQQVMDLVDQGVEGIFIAPVDWKAVKPALRYAKDKGVYIVVVDTEVYDVNLVDVMVTSDNYDIGVQMANYLKSQVSGANVLIISQEHVKSCIDRVDGFVNTLEKDENYAVKDTLYSDRRHIMAYDLVVRYYQSGESFDTLFAVNDTMALKALSATHAYKDTDVNVIGVDGSPAAKKMIVSGDLMLTAAQFPSEMGRQAASVMYELLNQQMAPKVIKIPVKLITKYTVNGYDLDKWQ